MWISCVCEYIVTNKLSYYSKLNQYLVFCPIKNVADLRWCFCGTNHNSLGSQHMCHLQFSSRGMYLVCSRAFFCLFENVAGMRLGRKFPSMLEKVNLAALWSRPRVMSWAHNSVPADREIHSWPGNEKVIKCVHT